MDRKMFRRFATRLSAVALCSAALCTAPLLAQGGGGGGRGMMMNPQAQVDSMTEQLGLTVEQQPKVLAILQETQKKMMEIRNSGADPSEMRPKMMALREDQQTKIKALLSEDQKPKYDAMIQAQMNRMRNGGGPGAPGAGTPPPAPPQ